MKTWRLAAVIALVVAAASYRWAWSGKRHNAPLGSAPKSVSSASRESASQPTETVVSRDTPRQSEVELSKLSQGDWASESDLKYQGRATPRAAYESLMWASTGGDVGTTADMLFFGPKALLKAEEIFGKLPPERRDAYGSPSKFVAMLFIGSAQRPTPAISYQLVGDEEGAKMPPVVLGLPESVATDPTYHTIQAKQRGPSGKEGNPVGVFHLTDDGWKWVIPPSMIDTLARRGLSNPSKPSSSPAPP